MTNTFKTALYSDFIASEMAHMKHSDHLTEEEKERSGACHFTHLINKKIIPIGEGEAQFFLEQEWARNNPTVITIRPDTQLSGIVAFPHWPYCVPDQVAILLEGVSIGGFLVPAIFISRITEDNDLYCQSFANTFKAHGIQDSFDVSLGDDQAKSTHWAVSFRVPITDQILSGFHITRFTGANIDALMVSESGIDYDAICAEIGIGLNCDTGDVREIVFDAHRLALAVIHHYSLASSITSTPRQILFENEWLDVIELNFESHESQ